MMYLWLCLFIGVSLICCEEEKLPDFIAYKAGLGKSVSLHCLIADDNYESLAWFRNDTGLLANQTNDKINIAHNLTGQYTLEEGTLTITHSTLEDEGFYYCQTVKEGVETKAKPFKLTFPLSPSCRQDNTTVSTIEVMEDTNDYIRCVAIGNPFPQVEWRKQDGEMAEHFTPSANGLSFRKVRPEDAGVYIVKLSNAVGISDIPFTLKVLSLDSIKPENYKSADEGKSVSIECGKSPISEKDTVRWSRKRVNLEGKHRFSINKKTGHLIIDPVKQSDFGLYTCASQRVTEQGVLTLSVNMYLDVKYAPKIITIKPLVVVFEGANAELPCNAIGNPGVELRWYMRGGNRIVNNNKYLIGHNGSLIVRSVAIGDVMNYTCHPKNQNGDGEIGYTKLEMMVPPTFHNYPSVENIVREGRNVTLDCSATSVPPPNITWSRVDGAEEALDPERFVATPSGFLTIVGVTGLDAGMYKCKVESFAGSLMRTARVTVIGRPGTPENMTIHTYNVTAKIDWQPSYSGGSKQKFQFWYRHTTDTERQWVTIEPEVNGTSWNMTFTEPAAENDAASYFFSMRAYNREGFSDFGKVLKVLQAPDQSYKAQPIRFLSEFPAAPYDLYVTSMETGYELKWESLVTPGRPEFSHFEVEYRKPNATGAWEVVTPKKSRKRRALTPTESKKKFVGVSQFPEGVTHPVDLQLRAVSVDGKRSEAVRPIGGVVIEVPGGTIPGRKVIPPPEESNLAPIILGAIFGVFLILLLVSLYCFCKKRKGRYPASKNQMKIIHQSENGSHEVGMEIDDTTDSANLLTKLEPEPPRRFHLRSCPALKAVVNKNNNRGDLEENGEDDRLLCTCSKSYVTLDRKDQLVSKREKKAKLFKSTSTPSIALNSDGEETIDPLELLDEEEYDLSDDKLTDLHQEKFNSLKRSKFKDSYDQFCRGDDARNSKTEADKHILMDNSSENSATESERAPSKHNSKGNLSNAAKSSGYGDGSNSTSDSESVQDKSLKRGYQSDHNRPDYGYASDISARSDTYGRYPRPPSRQKYGRGMSDDGSDRPALPPPYTQALHDIERLSEKNEVTDSEELYDQLLQMEREMGIDNSVEGDLNTKGRPPSRPTSRNGYHGYEVGTYSDREKNERCKQLLNEFKTQRQSGNDSGSEVAAPPYDRCRSVMDDITEENRPPLQRSNSVGSSSVYKEWLV